MLENVCLGEKQGGINVWEIGENPPRKNYRNPYQGTLSIGGGESSTGEKRGKGQKLRHEGKN